MVPVAESACAVSDFVGLVMHACSVNNTPIDRNSHKDFLAIVASVSID
jgi:hypothetical protein